MKVIYSIFGLMAFASAQDRFNYEKTSGTDYGPEDWDEVSCNNLATCPGWPAKLIGSQGWRPNKNQCEWCPITGNSCGQHRQSPIDLDRDRAIIGDPNEKECPDWHWIQYLDGTCSWEDMQDQFEIGRHALMIHTPLRSNGDIDCVNEAGERKFPKMDYSKGFPDWWYLSRTDITVPSEHTQHGQRYAAEIKLSHFYEIDHYKNKLGIISLFMQDFEGEPSWPYLDKLICKWRSEEEKKRESCGLPPAPVYQMCELYRGQTRSADDIAAPTEAVSFPTRAPLVPPPSIPIQNFGGDPEEFRLPLALCQGDCDFSSDCAPGLICHRRDAFGAVPGCIGGETDDTNTDYCVFDPYGPGYTVPTESPTNAPTVTARPTLVPLTAQPLRDYGGTPPAEKFPLQICEGDCDKDVDCAEGLICFQRTSNETVPGCIGGELDIEKTDYCILDPYGDGYEMPMVTDPPVTTSPISTATVAPTLKENQTPSSQPMSLPTTAPVPTQAPTHFIRPVGEPMRVKNLGWEPPLPISECGGDCDIDEDCEVGLICYQRNEAYENVPGCLGGDEDPSLTDYCTFPPLPTTAPAPVAPTSGPTGAPVTAAPSKQPTTSAPTTPLAKELPNVTVISWSPQVLLKECEGDCDNNDDCLPGLKCFQRNKAGVEVPGCQGGALDKSLTDYCIKDPSVVDDKIGGDSSGGGIPSLTAKPTPKPTFKATLSPTSAPSKDTTVNDTSDALPPLKDLGWTPPPEVKPLGRCEGDCDIRQDCGPGLDCYQRYLPNLPVPGCSGGESDSTLTDYCIPIEFMNGGDRTETSPSTTKPVASPTDAPREVQTQAPTAQTPTPVATIETTVAPVVPSPLDCSAFPSDVHFFRMCKQDSCCTNPRSETEFCHEQYRLLGDDVEAACHHCCLEENGTSKSVGPANEAHPTIPKLLECDAVVEPDRTCRADSSCCDSTGSHHNFCKEQYLRYTPEELDSICWYCCHPSKEVDIGSSRKLADSKSNPVPTRKLSHAQRKALYNNATLPLGDNDRMTHDVSGRPVIVRQENFEEKGMMDEDEYFETLMSSFRKRNLQQSQQENYDDVPWWPYEWLLKVGTEYYFRYEGTQTVPPCYDTAHWRVFKDPIRVAPHQMRELERLIAWRRGDNCQADTAGKPTGDPDRVDVARPLQSFHKLHRKVFCECKDWPSKFPADRQWCRNWQNKAPEERLIESPYNFPSDGFNFI